MDLSIIIVNWNSKDYLRKCLASVLAETRGLTYEIIVIDSASFDGSEEMVRTEFPAVKFIQSQENLGFSKSNNRAFEASCGEYVLFLNPDTEVLGSSIQTLHKLIASLPDAGAVGCRLLNTDGTLQTSCVQAFPTILNQLLSAEALRRLSPRSGLWGMRAIFENNNKPAAVDMISGACLLMRRSVFEKAGRFSTDYFMYAEDVDLCYKARKLGLTNYYFGGAYVVHHGGGSSHQARSNFSNIMLVESIRQFLQKWRGSIYSYCYRFVLSLAALIRVAFLVVLSPLLLVKSGGARWQASCSKWMAIFGWGLGISRWTKDYRKN